MRANIGSLSRVGGFIAFGCSILLVGGSWLSCSPSSSTEPPHRQESFELFETFEANDLTPDAAPLPEETFEKSSDRGSPVPELTISLDATIRLLDGVPEADPDPDSLPQGVSFRKQILPIIDRYACGNIYCHGNGAGNFFTHYEPDDAYKEMVGRQSSQRASWVLVVPGAPKKSLFFLKIASDNPPFGKRMGILETKDILLIYAWILQGAKNN